MTEERTFAFTEARIKALPPAPERAYYTDAQIRALKLCVHPTGSKTFVLNRRIHGKPERLQIGRWPDLSVMDARKTAQRMLGEIAQGKRPVESSGRRTLTALFDEYVKLHGRTKRESSLREDQGIFRRYLEPWGPRKLNTLQRPDLERLHREIGERNGRYAANRCLSLLSVMFRRALDWGWVGSSPVVGIKDFREEPRQRFLSESERVRLLAALDEDPDRSFQDYIELSLATGARSGNLLSLRFDEIDLRERVWLIPGTKTKNHRPQPVRLSDEALAILIRRSAQAPLDCPWVFPSPTLLNAPITTYRPQWDRLMKRAGIVGLRPHDLRHAVGTWMRRAGSALPVISRALGHSQLATTMIYSHAEDPELAQAMQKASTSLLRRSPSPKLLEADPAKPAPDSPEGS
jgi:integrase